MSKPPPGWKIAPSSFVSRYRAAEPGELPPFEFIIRRYMGNVIGPGGALLALYKNETGQLCLKHALADVKHYRMVCLEPGTYHIHPAWPIGVTK